MPTMPKDQIHEGLPAEGWHLAEVQKATAKQSKGGDDMYNLELRSAEDGSWLCYDNIMLTGKGNGMGFRRLLALGAARDLGDEYDFDTADRLVGKRAYVYIKHGEWDGKPRAEVDVRQGRAGYWPADQELPGVEPEAADPTSAYGYAAPLQESRETPPHGDDDIPF